MIKRTLALLCALAILAETTPVLAQPVNLPANTVWGRLGVGTGPGQAIPIPNLLSAATGCTTNGDFNIIESGAATCSSAAGATAVLAGPLTINPAAGSTTRAIATTQTSPTSGSIAGPLSFNLLNITDSILVTGSGSDSTGNNNAGTVGFRVNTLFAGANLNGASTLLSGLFSATVTSTAALADIVGLAGTAYTNVVMTHSGFLEGLNGVAQVGPTGSANILSGVDAGSGIQTGGAANYRLGVNLSSFGTTRGTTLDAAIAVVGVGGNPAWGSILELSNLAGAAPVNGTTKIIHADTAYTVSDFASLANMTITDHILNFPNVHLRGNASLALGTSNNPGSNSIVATGGITANGTLASGGAGVGNGVLSLGGNSSGGWNLTANATATLATATGSLATSGSITDSNNGIATTSTDGMVLQNTTAAAAGVQQYSPRLHFIAQGWKTNATAASQTVDWIIENEPSQGTAAPSSFLAFLSQINAGGYTAQLSISSGGALNVTTSVQSPLHFGGTAAGSTLTLESTTGAGTTDSIAFRTGSQVYAGGINTTQQWSIGTNVTPATNAVLTVGKNAAASRNATLTPLLHMVSADSTQSVAIIDGFGGAGKQPFIVTRNANGTGASPTAILANDQIGFFGMVGATGAGTYAAENGAAGGVFFGGVATENWSLTNQGAKINIYTTPNTTAAIALAATVHASGCLAVGVTTDCLTGGIIALKAVQTGTTTVGALPACGAGIKGARYFVTDANATTFHATVAGGGANNVGVTCDGTNWYISANDNMPEALRRKFA